MSWSLLLLRASLWIVAVAVAVVVEFCGTATHGAAVSSSVSLSLLLPSSKINGPRLLLLLWQYCSGLMILVVVVVASVASVAVADLQLNQSIKER